MARKRRTAVARKKDTNTNKNCTTSEGGSSEEKDGPSDAKPSTAEKPAGPVKRKQTKDDQAPLLPTRTSARIPKRVRRDSPPTSPCPPKKPAREHHPKASTSTPEAKKKQPPKQRRAWEQWSVADKSLFFEGLLEYGKDFDPLTNYVAVRQKKRLSLPPTLIKNKEQIRHFYYRTWHKISKWIEPAPDIKKQTQELYGLVNYNEIRKIFGGRIDEKIGPQLNELVHRGFTQIKVRGKLHRLKTPMCRALKRLNGIEDPKDDGAVKLPQKITLELRPKTNDAWAYVQSLAQNPRVRMTLRLDRRLSSVMEFLEKKWRPQRLKIREKLKLPCTPDKLIKISPPDGCAIVQATLKNKPPAKKIDIALDSHANNLKAIGYDPSATTKKMSRGKSQASNKNQSAISSIPAVKNIHEDAVFPSAVTAHVTPPKSDRESVSGRLDFSNTVSFNDGKIEFKLNGVDCVNSMDKMMTDEKVDVEEICPIVTDIAKPCAKSFSPCSGEKRDEKTDVREKTDVIVEKPVENTTVPSGEKPGNKTSGADQLNIGGLVEYSADKVDNVTFEQKFRAGWVLDEAKCVTLAEIYLALGSPETTILEYELLDIAPPKKNIPPEVMGDSSSNKTGCDMSTKNASLVGMMYKLVQLATTEFVDLSKSRQTASSSSPSQCSCGATLKGVGTPPAKSGCRSPGSRRSPSIASQGKSPVTPRGPGRRAPRSKKEKEAPQKEQQPPPASAARGAAPEKSSTDPEVAKSPDSVFRVPHSVPVKAATYSNSQQALINQTNKVINAAEESRARQFIQQFDSLTKRNGEGMMKRCRMRNRTVRKPMLVQRAILPKAQVPGRPGMVPLLPHGQAMDASTGQFVPIMTNNPITGQTIGSMPSNTVVAQSLVAQQGTRMISGPHSTVSRPMLRKIAPCQTVTTANASYNSTISMPSNSLKTVARALPMTTPTSLPQSSVLSPLTVDVPKVMDDPVVTSTQPVSTTRSESLILSAAMASSLDISTPSISSLLDISMPGHEASETQDAMPDSADKLIDLALGSSTTFSDFLSSAGKISPPGLASPPLRTEGAGEIAVHMVGQSPFKVDMSNWLHGEASCDISLGSFLDSPLKKMSDPVSTATQPVPFFCDNSRDSITSKFDGFQVESTLQCMMNESSMDYVSKFADLAAQISAVADHQQDMKK